MLCGALLEVIVALAGIGTAVTLSLVATYNGTMLLGHALPLTGLIGAPLLIASTIAVFFGIIEPISPWTAIATLPVALWELSLGLWLTFKGFQPSPSPRE